VRDQSSYRTSKASKLTPHGTVDIALQVFLFHGFALVVKLFTFADSQQHFCSSAFEIHLQGDQGEILFKRLVGEFVHFATMHQKFPPPFGDVVQLVRVFVFLDVAADEPNLPFFDAGVGLFERQLSSAQAFDLAPHQHDATFQGVEHRVVVTRLAVVGDCFFVLIIGFFRRRFVALLIGRSNNSEIQVSEKNGAPFEMNNRL
jgi:hypothetical protein